MINKGALLIILTVVFLGCSPKNLHTSKNKSGQDTREMTQASVLSLHNKKFNWMIEGKTDSLEMVLHPDLMYIHSNGWTETKEEMSANLKNGKLEYHKVHIKESQVRVSGNTAIVTGKGVFSVSLEGKQSEFPLYYTEVYVLDNDTTRLISRHACRWQP